MNVVLAFAKCCANFFRRRTEAGDVGNVRKGNDFRFVANGIDEQVNNFIN
jgi:hypothetical protein